MGHAKDRFRPEADLLANIVTMCRERLWDGQARHVAIHAVDLETPNSLVICEHNHAHRVAIGHDALALRDDARRICPIASIELDCVASAVTNRNYLKSGHR